MSNSFRQRQFESVMKRKNFSFSVLQWNAGGLSASKFHEIKKIVFEEDVDILIIQEANITKDKINRYNMKDFTMHGLYKSRQIASGILVAIKNKLTSSFKVVKEMNSHDTSEIVEINIWNGNSHLKIYGIYSPPNNTNLNLDIMTPFKNSIIVGDFNAASPNWGYTYKNQVGQIVEDFVDTYALLVLYDKNDPKTFIHHTGSSTNPDLSITSANIAEQCKKTVLGDPGSGHRMIKTSFTTKIKLKNVPSKTMWNFRKANWNGFANDVEEKISYLINEISPYKKASMFTSILLNCAKKNIPRGKMKTYRPFWNEEIAQQQKIRDQARQRAEKIDHKTEAECRQDVIVWRRENAIMKKKILEAKRATWNNFLNKMDYRTDGKKAYNLINTLNNKRTQIINHPIVFENREVQEPSIIAKKFNDYFLCKYSISQQQKKKERRLIQIKSKESRDLDPIVESEFTVAEINQAINNIQSGKQPGPDKVFPEFIKHLGRNARIFLLSIYNTFWSKNISLPNDWVKAIVIPILKPGKPRENADSYRPISLTSILVKIFERMLCSRIKFLLEAKELINEEQAGFRSNMSTNNSIMKIVHKVKTGFNLKRSSLAVFVDFQGAYDTIWRKGLLYKLKSIGIGGNMLNWIKRFLAQRWVKTKWNDTESHFRQSKIGLPQGSVCSCPLFNIYTNDLISKLKEIPGANVSMFADDLVIWIEAKNSRNYQVQKQILEDSMNKALETLQLWCKENYMFINKNKTVYQFFSLRKLNINFELVIDNVTLNRSDSTKYLGVVLDNKLSFTDHVKAITKKVEDRITMMKRLAGAKWGSTQATLNTTYNVYVKPIIKYGSEVLISASKDKIDTLERAQNKALRVIIGAVKTTPITAMQIYTSNPPINVEIQKQAVGSYIKMLASHRAEWLQDQQPSTLKTQTSPVEMCQRILEDLDANIPVESTMKIISPNDYIDIESNLSILNLMKKDSVEAELKATSLYMINELFPEEEWLRVYTDGSQMLNNAGAGVFCKLFAESAPVGYHKSNFDAEIFAIHLALENLKTKTNEFSKVVLLVDSISAIQAITENHCYETKIIGEIKCSINFLKNLHKSLVFQWIPSHIGIKGNENADLLAKTGTTMPQEIAPVTPTTLKKYVINTCNEINNNNLTNISRGKLWENIQDSWKIFSSYPRNEAVANFRLQTGHDCLAEHLFNMKILTTKVCPICKTDTLNSDHLLKCKGLNKDSQKNGDFPKLYWEARTLMNHLQI